MDSAAGVDRSCARMVDVLLMHSLFRTVPHGSGGSGRGRPATENKHVAESQKWDTVRNYNKLKRNS